MFDSIGTERGDGGNPSVMARVRGAQKIGWFTHGLDGDWGENFPFCELTMIQVRAGFQYLQDHDNLIYPLPPTVLSSSRPASFNAAKVRGMEFA